MRTALIVEDEYYVRAGIVRRVPWAQLGLRLVGEAADGAEALAFLRGRPVDILITDIRMPEMDGIQLIEAAHALCPETRYVILSGYSDFAYTRSAIRLGVSDYILKPVDEGELAATLRRILAELNGSPAGPRAFERYEQLPDGPVSPPAGPCFVLLLSAERMPEPGRIRALLEGERGDGFRLQGDLCAKPPLLRVIVDGPEIGEADAARLARRLLAGLSAGDGSKARAGMSSAAAPDGLGEAGAAAMRALRSRMFAGDGVIQASALPAAGGRGNADVLRAMTALQDALALRDRQAVRTQVGLLFSMDWRDADSLGTMLRYLFDVVRTCGEPEDPHLAGFTGGGDALLAFDTLDELRQALAPAILDHFMRGMDLPGDDVAAEAREYIQRHLDGDLRVSALAERFHLSPNYFSFVFRRDTGVTLSEYIERARMRRACQLLRAGCSVVRTASLLGYSDAGYFSRAFKKATGQAPLAYRRQAGDGEG